MSKRTRTIEWEDPRINSRDTKNISGMDYLCALRDGNIAPPPAAKLVGYHIVSVHAGEAKFELTPSEYQYNPFSTVHGGILSTLLDAAMTAAVMTTLAPGKACSTLELKINFIRPISSRTGPVTARATLIHTGRQVATVEGRLFDKNEKLYAHAISTCMIISL